MPSLLPMYRLGVVLKAGFGAKRYSMVYVEDLCHALVAAAVSGKTLSREDPSAGVPVSCSLAIPRGAVPSSLPGPGFRTGLSDRPRPDRPGASDGPNQPRTREGNDMKYLCLAYGDQRKMEALTKGEFEDLVARCKGHDEELRRTGQVLMTCS